MKAYYPSPTTQIEWIRRRAGWHKEFAFGGCRWPIGPFSRWLWLAKWQARRYVYVRKLTAGGH